ncbi:MAG: D-alanine--D-alanine ligase [Gammaproteobacteria bacterium]|nr:D-alanine--D-alanine ligase [Gammaproteobacteria bacterium]
MTFRSVEEYGKVAVLMGGTSAEREISLKSGQAVLEALLRKGVDAHKVDAADSVIAALQNGGYSRVFNMLHGRMGEDGIMQGALELLGLPYTGSGVLGSALGMNKLRTKEVWIANDLPTPPYVVMRSRADVPVAIEKLKLPIFVKPAHEGSSIGITKAGDEAALEKAWMTANDIDDTVIAEGFIKGAEYTCAILGRDVLPLIRLETPHEFYDFHAKYVANTTKYHCPCGLDEETEKSLQALALRAFDVADARGWGRVDMMVAENGKPYLIEINTLPGMTDHSLVPMAAKQAGIEFDDLVLRILESSMTGASEGGFGGC